jgi:hypothetical protein
MYKILVLNDGAKTGKTDTETFQLINQTYGDDDLSYTEI